MKKRMISGLLLAVVLVVFCVPRVAVLAEEETADESIVLSNDHLTAEFGEDGSFVVNDRLSGMIFASSLSTDDDRISEMYYRNLVSSEIAVHFFLTEESISSEQTNIAFSKHAVAEVSKEGECICVKYDFTECKVKFNVEYSLDEDLFVACVNLNSIEEYGEFSVSRIDVLPGFGAGTAEDDGYMLVPDGCGALIHFNNGVTSQYEAEVYGEEKSQDVALQKSNYETIRMPVFGISNAERSVFGIITTGDALATINACSGSDAQCYNAIYSSVNITFTTSKKMFEESNKNERTAYYKSSQTENQSRYAVKYAFLTGDDADYSGMASRYRRYLTEVDKLKQNVSEPVLNVDVYGAIDEKRNFLGLNYYAPLKLTGYKEVGVMAERLKSAGIDALSFRYIGWSNDGMSNETPLKKLKTMRVLGGKKAFETMVETLENLQVDISYDVDFTKFYRGNKKYTTMTPFNEQLTYTPYLRSVYAKDTTARSWHILTPAYWVEHVEKIFSSSDRLELDNLSIDSLTSDVYSDFRTRNGVSRDDTRDIAVDILKQYSSEKQIFGSAVNAYAFPYVNKIIAAPTYTSGYKIFDEEVPFYQMVLHGLVDMTAQTQFTSTNARINFLKAVESGSQLLYSGIYGDSSEIKDTDYDYLYSTNYELWLNDAVEKYSAYQPLLKKIFDQEIVEHTRLIDNVFKTNFSNGVSVIVNYNDTMVSVNGVTVDGYGFCEVIE